MASIRQLKYSRARRQIITALRAPPLIEKSELRQLKRRLRSIQRKIKREELRAPAQRRGVLWGLDGRKPIRAANSCRWGALMQRKRRNWIVGQTSLGDKHVSTVFLGIDPSLAGPPQLFETMIFGLAGDSALPMWRYPTWDAALAGHQAIVANLRDKLTNPVPGTEE
jgi:hypothetical protein